MGPFRRGKRESPAPPSSIDLKVQDTMYRRLGEAMAMVVVTLADPPPDDAQLVIRTDSSDMAVAPMMVTHEVPGTKAEVRRLWFAVELSAVMFGDGDFGLKTAEGETPLPHPVAQVGWGDDDPDEPGVPAAALSEAALRAAVAILEERCREAERANAELSADARRVSDAVAATLAEVQRERERLLEHLARSSAKPG
jgi:hypothetical protein